MVTTIEGILLDRVARLVNGIEVAGVRSAKPVLSDWRRRGRELYMHLLYSEVGTMATILPIESRQHGKRRQYRAGRTVAAIATATMLG